MHTDSTKGHPSIRLRVDSSSLAEYMSAFGPGAAIPRVAPVPAWTRVQDHNYNGRPVPPDGQQERSVTASLHAALRVTRRKKKRLMILEPCAARNASVAHNPPLDRQASWHQCLTECQRVDDLVAMECAKRELKKTKKRRISPEPCHAARLSVVSGNDRKVNKA